MKINLNEKTSQFLCVFFGILGIAGLIIYLLLLILGINTLGYLSVVNKFTLEIIAVIILFNVIFLILRSKINKKSLTIKAKLKNFLVTIIPIAIGSYVVICLFIYFNQDELINKNNTVFQPQRFNQTYLEDNVEKLSITAPGNIKLQGWLVKNSPKSKSPLIIYFGGSGQEVSPMADYMKNLDGYSVAYFNYRGFGLSEGSPNQDNCFNDAKLIYDTLSKRDDIDSKKIMTMGWSLGTCVSVYLSDNRPIKGTILVSPLESISNRIPLYPLMMKQSFNSISLASNINCPLLCLIGDKDINVLPKSSMNLVKKWKGTSDVKIYKDNDHFLLFKDNNSWSDIKNFLKSLK